MWRKLYVSKFVVLREIASGRKIRGFCVSMLFCIILIGMEFATDSPCMHTQNGEKRLIIINLARLLQYANTMPCIHARLLNRGEKIN